MLTRQQLKRRIDSFMEEEVLKIVAEVPSSLHLIDERQELNDAYYLRHRIETVKRIRLTSRTDALALAAMVEEDYEAARWWSKYTQEELNHDLLFLKDLAKHGLTEKKVFAIAPFASTVAMVDAIAASIKKIGSLGAVSYSVWVEWNSERSSAKVMERAARKYSTSHVRGSKAHVNFDQTKNHYDIMLNIAYRLLQRFKDEDILFEQLRLISGHIANYFRELEECTFGNDIKARSVSSQRR